MVIIFPCDRFQRAVAITLMSPTLSVAASLSPDTRQDIGIQVLSHSQPISHLAATHQVSRKFVYQQGDKAQRSLDETFAPTQMDDEVLFHLPVTKTWLYQLILGLVLICHSSYRGVVELFRDLFDMPISIGTVHNRLQATAGVATAINQTQDLSGIEVGLNDEIYQANRPVLVGVDAASTDCYLLQSKVRPKRLKSGTALHYSPLLVSTLLLEEGIPGPGRYVFICRPSASFHQPLRLSACPFTCLPMYLLTCLPTY